MSYFFIYEFIFIFWNEIVKFKKFVISYLENHEVSGI